MYSLITNWFHSEKEYEEEFNMFMRGSEAVPTTKPQRIQGFTPEQVIKIDLF